MGHISRSELRPLLGLENSRWREAQEITFLLQALAKPADKIDYKFANNLFLLALFSQIDGIVHYKERRCLWYLNVTPVSFYSRQCLELGITDQLFLRPMSSTLHHPILTIFTPYALIIMNGESEW